MAFTVVPELTDEVARRHVAAPAVRPADRALVRLSMVSSADGASELSGVSGGLGGAGDRLVFAHLRRAADAVVVGVRTAAAEHYRPTGPEGPHLYLVASRPETDAPLDLLGAPGVTLVLPEDAGPAGEGIATWRLGQGGRVDLGALVGQLAGQTVALEGGPTLAGLLAAQGLVDELFLTLAPRVVGGSSPRVVHGAESPPGPWSLEQGLVDGEGFVYLRYHRPEPHLV